MPTRSAIAGVIVAVVLSSVQAGAMGMRNPFFAMDTGTQDAAHKTPAEQVELVKEIGFDGVGPTYHDAAELQQWLVALDRNRLKMFALYLELRLDDLAPSVARVKEAADALSGRGTLLWIYVTDKNGTPSGTNDDPIAVQALRDIAVYAKGKELRVALYPHTGFYVQRVEDAVRLAAKVRRENVGVTFNLCHWLKVDGTDLAATLEAAKPYLLCVTINGADKGGNEWNTLIQPLDSGTYDVAGLLARLRRMKYAGPIGLQHYGINGDARQNLERSMAAWKTLADAE